MLAGADVVMLVKVYFTGKQIANKHLKLAFIT
jgi:hypothetical protein